MKDSAVTNGRRRSWRQTKENMVQWKQNNIKDGFVVVDEAQLSKLIKREPVQKYYKLEDTPFATGLFATVRRCQSLTTGEPFAAKFSNRKRYGEDCSAEIYHEIAVLSLCGGAPRVIQIHDVFETPQEIILVMEFAPGGDLQTIIDDNLVPYESDVVSYIRQCLEGLEYLHNRRIAHLDIKPQNVVMMGQFPDCQIKLCDFEISRVILDGSEIREILGTPDYVAPEILHYDPITLAADMWSLGVTTYVLLTGFSPFGGDTDQETFCNISRGEVDLPDELFEDTSQHALDFIRSLLVKDPKARPTAAQCLRHPWIAQTTAKKPIPPPSSPSALRKYLSKSREALFDKVVQKHKSTLRKHTLQNQMLRSRLCESHMSLVSKSREKLLNQEKMSPSFSRSIEKIYGLRSLSKSQEVLNMYKNGNLMTSQENINNVVTEMLKSRENLTDRTEPDSKDRRLTRATTADLGVLRHKQRHMRIYSGSSTTSIVSDMAEELEDREADAGQENPEEPNGHQKEENGEETQQKAENGQEQPTEGERKSSVGEGVEEPRFTVAQLVTAFNKHQEIVTKTSLEVTMTTPQKEAKLPPILPYVNQVPFPTGPTALRLFIPGIDLVEMPKNRPRHSLVIHPAPTTPPTCLTAPVFCVDTTPTQELDLPNFLRSTSLSSDASTGLSETTPESSLEPTIEEKPALRPSTLQVGQRRSKSQSPSPVTEADKSQVRKLSTGSYGDQKRKTSVRKSSVTDKSPLPQRRTSTGDSGNKKVERKTSTGAAEFKIVGLAERNRKSHAISYKIEFASPVVSRRFPVRTPGVCAKSTISSELKKQDNLKPKRK